MLVSKQLKSFCKYNCYGIGFVSLLDEKKNLVVIQESAWTLAPKNPVLKTYNLTNRGTSERETLKEQNPCNRDL